MDKTKVKLRICDIDCTITSDDNEEYVRTIGDEIDRAISAVLKKNDRISLSMAAIITAMTYCDESAKAKAELAELKTLDKNRANEYERLKQAAETAQTEAEQLRSELQVLHAFLTEDKDLEKMPGLPFDQHFLLSLIAPRKLYVSSAKEDLWADPAAEVLGCLAASPAFEAAGVPGLAGVGEEPQLGQAYHQGNIGYHLRAGGHFLSREDWRQFAAYLFFHREK